MEALRVIDFHTHIYPWPEIPPTLQEVKSLTNKVLGPISRMHHLMHSKMRKLPKPFRAVMDELGTPITLPHLLTESSVQDLLREMQENMVIHAVVMPHPPLMTNHFVISECKDRPQLIPGVFLEKKSVENVEDLKIYLDAGHKVFKINPLQSGIEASDLYYQDLLNLLNERNAILVLHTGNIESRLFFKAPSSGDIENFASWFADFPKIKFLAAHMNFHEPEKAIELARKHANLQLICSWQPAEVIESALRILGGSKLLFGSDWPLLGGNISFKKQQLLMLFEKRRMTQTDLERILWKNADELLRLA